MISKKNIRTAVVAITVGGICLGQIARFTPYYKYGMRSNPIFYDAATKIERLLQPDELFLSTGFVMLLVDNPVVPLLPFLEERWQMHNDTTVEPTIPFPRYAILRDFKVDQSDSFNVWREQFISDNFVPLSVNETAKRSIFAYIVERKDFALHTEE